MGKRLRRGKRPVAPAAVTDASEESVADQSARKKPAASSGLVEEPQPAAPPVGKQPLGSRARFCLTCQKLKLDWYRHHHDFPDHTCRKPTQEERDQLAASLPPLPTGDCGKDYKMIFGKHKG